MKLSTIAPESRDGPGILTEDALAEAAHKFLLYHFARMLSHEAGARQGEDMEEVHDMRVAIRRMRAAFRVAEAAFEPKIVKPYLKGLRAAGRALGPVRDLDVFMQKAEEYLAGRPEGERAGLAPLIGAWREERKIARASMLAFLTGKRYRNLKKAFHAFLRTPDPLSVVSPLVGRLDAALPHAGGGRKTDTMLDTTGLRTNFGRPAPVRVREVAPMLIYERLAAVRAYGPALHTASFEQLHRLRIEFKRLRYAVEFFQEVLGDEAREVIADLKQMQDHLGSLNDANVACQVLSEFLEGQEEKPVRRQTVRRNKREPVAAYLALQHAERQQLLVSFPEAWAYFERPEFRRNLALAISVL